MFTYGPSRRDIGRTIAAAVDQVLAGHATADRPRASAPPPEVGRAVRWPTTPMAAGSSR
jgi:hypothetical protein